MDKMIAATFNEITGQYDFKEMSDDEINDYVSGLVQLPFKEAAPE